MIKKRNWKDNRKRINGPKIVVIGGGTGSSILLGGLKNFTANITAIVTVADDGGGSGVLREDLGMLPPGDIRACLLALANTEPTMEKMLQYRFKGGCLDGQSFGNLFLAAMNGIYGSFDLAIKEASNVLAITGQVLPMTLADINLSAELENGIKVIGESNIPIVSQKENSRIKKMFLESDKTPEALEDGIMAIEEADLIVLGPGSLYTSVIPNLLINDISKNIYESRAKKVYVSNIMTQPGETNEYSVLNHIEAVLKHSREDLLDYVIVNNQEIPEEILKRYEEDESYPVYLEDGEEELIKSMGIKVIKCNLIEIEKGYIKHNNLNLSQVLMDLHFEPEIYNKYE